MKMSEVKYTKNWIRPGLVVYHRDYRIKIIVDKIVSQAKEFEFDGKKETKKFIVGVRCHWIDKNSQPQVATFHTRELIPEDIYELGVDAMNKWLELKNKK